MALSVVEGLGESQAGGTAKWTRPAVAFFCPDGIVARYFKNASPCS